jgi:hypothetical protein
MSVSKSESNKTYLGAGTMSMAALGGRRQEVNGRLQSGLELDPWRRSDDIVSVLFPWRCCFNALMAAAE